MIDESNESTSKGIWKIGFESLYIQFFSQKHVWNPKQYPGKNHHDSHKPYFELFWELPRIQLNHSNYIISPQKSAFKMFVDKIHQWNPGYIHHISIASTIISVLNK